MTDVLPHRCSGTRLQRLINHSCRRPVRCGVARKTISGIPKSVRNSFRRGRLGRRSHPAALPLPPPILLGLARDHGGVGGKPARCHLSDKLRPEPVAFRPPRMGLRSRAVSSYRAQGQLRQLPLGVLLAGKLQQWCCCPQSCHRAMNPSPSPNRHQIRTGFSGNDYGIDHGRSDHDHAFHRVTSRLCHHRRHPLLP
jgi:hypothetical protein